MIGIEGVLGYEVARRTREFGIRMALGGGPSDVLRLVFREALTLAAAGLAIGLAGAAALSRVLAGLLYGVTPGGPRRLPAGVAGALGAVAIAASSIPALRATRVGSGGRAQGGVEDHRTHLTFSTYFNPQQLPLTAWALLKAHALLQARGGATFGQYLRATAGRGRLGALPVEWRPAGVRHLRRPGRCGRSAVRIHGLAGAMFWDYDSDPNGALLGTLYDGLRGPGSTK